MTNEETLAGEFAAETIACLEYGCIKIQHCLNQIDNQQVWWRPDESMNSIGNLLLHLAGNLGQWIVAGVGDAVDVRERQSEFDERGPIPKQQLWRRLEKAVEESKAALRRLSLENLLSNKQVQGHDVTKLHAAMHSVSHFQGHVQEIICLTRQQLGERYEYQWQPSRAEGAV